MRKLILTAQVVLLALGFIFVFVLAAAATQCQDKPGSETTHWFYRLIDGKRCWFPANGLRRATDKPKNQLHWDALPEKRTFVESEPPPWITDDLPEPAVAETNNFDSVTVDPTAVKRLYEWRMREELMRDAFKSFGRPDLQILIRR